MCVGCERTANCEGEGAVGLAQQVEMHRTHQLAQDSGQRCCWLVQLSVA